MPPDSMRIAILCPGDREARSKATGETSRFADLFRAFAGRVRAELAIYHDEFRSEVREQLLRLDGVLVWMNPLEGGRDRSGLDAMLGEVAAAGVFVSAHPEVILKLGTKEVLYRTRDLSWGCDTHLYADPAQLSRELPLRLAAGKPRVLKRHRGNGGNGVWKIELARAAAGAAPPSAETVVRARHAMRGGSEEEITLGEFYRRCEPYFYSGGRIVDQEYQERLPEGMIRCYLVHDKVAGFGHQAVNALFPAPPGAPASKAPQPGPRLYHPPTVPEFQDLKSQLESEWLPAAQRLLEIEKDDLPIIWDCDFLLGPKRAGKDSYVLCEINASSVAPYPPFAVSPIVAATLARVRAAQRRRAARSEASAAEKRQS